MRAEFIHSCSTSSDVLDYYDTKEGKKWKRAGKEIKKAIAALNFFAYFPFNYKNLCSKWFTVERMRYKNKLYAIVTNSEINYIFLIYE